MIDGGPTLETGKHLLLLADPLEPDVHTDPMHVTLAHIDSATERLIVVVPTTVDLDTETATGRYVFVLALEPGQAYYARAFRIENVQRPRSAIDAPHVWLVLRPSGRWQRIERRRSERAAVPSLKVVGRRYPLTGGSPRFDGELRDISEGGVLLSSTQRPQLNDVIEFDVPIDPPFRVRMRVLRVQHAQADPQTWLIGCSFEGLSVYESARISDYVATLGAAPPAPSDQHS